MTEFDDLYECDPWEGIDGFDFELEPDAPLRKKKTPPPPLPEVRAMSKAREHHIKRRAMSEAHMNEVLDWHLKEGHVYHVISGGDVDALTYLRGIVKQQPLDYAIVSTWCMGMTDAQEIGFWMKAGLLKRLDVYIGEIFMQRDPDIYEFFLKEVMPGTGGRVAALRNHAKVMVGYGPEFDFAIASSANVNTNPRIENTTITVDTEVADFYKDFFDSIHPFNPDGSPTDWKPWRRERWRRGGRRPSPRPRPSAGRPPKRKGWRMPGSTATTTPTASTSHTARATC